jgi:hypothetical protein
MSTAQGRVELAAHGRQVRGQQVQVFAHHAQRVQVGHDALDEVRRLEQFQGLRFLVGAEHRHLRRRGPPLARLGDERVLQGFEFEQHGAQLALQRVLAHPQLDAGRAQERRPAARGVQVQRVHEVRPQRRVGRRVRLGLAPRLHVDLHDFGARVLLPASHAPSHRAGVELQLVGQLCRYGVIGAFPGRVGRQLSG